MPSGTSAGRHSWDLADNQGDTAEGIHIASAGGTWQTIVCGFGGFRVRNGQMTFKPWLPPDWNAVDFRLKLARQYRVGVRGSHLCRDIHAVGSRRL